MADKLSVIITPIISTAVITKEIQKFSNMIEKKPIRIPVKPLDKRTTDSITGFTGKIKELFKAVGKVAIWTVATSAIFGTIRALKGLVREFINLEDQLVAIERVTSGLSLEKIFDESLDASIELAVGLKDVLAVMEELGRTYADLDEMQLKTAASNAVLLASVTDMTSATAVSGLIAITQAYNIAIEDSIDVVDALNIVNNNYAIGAADLSRSLERSASAAAEVGVSFANLIGFTTAIKTSTRESGSVIGNSLKTIVIRLQSNSEALREVQEAGVAVYGEDGQLRRAEDIIGDLAVRWDGLSKNQKVNIGVAVAGQRQYTRFAALMQNYDIATSAATEALNSQGNALEENEKRLKTISAQTVILGNKTLSLAQSFGETLKPAIMGIIAIAQALIGTIRWLIDTFGDGAIWVAAFTLGMWGFFKVSAALILPTEALTAALIKLGAAVPYIAIALAVSFLITEVIKYNKARKEEIKLQKRSIQGIREESQSIEELTKKYKELKSASALTTAQEEELLQVQTELIRLLPTLTTMQDAYGNVVLISINALESELRLLNQISLESAIKEMDDLKKAAKDASSSINVAIGVMQGGFVGSGRAISIATEAVSSFEEISNKLADGTLTLEQTINAYESLGVILSKNNQILEDYIKSTTLVTMGTLDIDDANRETIDTFKSLIDSEELVISKLEESMVAFDGLIASLNNGVDSTNALTIAFDELGFSYEDFINKVDEVEELDPFTSTELNDFKIFNTVMQDLFNVTEDNIKAVSKAIDIIKLYGNATELTTTQQNEYNRALGFLSDMFPQLKGNVEDNIDVVKAFADTWTLAAANQDAYVEAVSAGIVPVTQETADAIQNNIDALKEERDELEKNLNLLDGAESPDYDYREVEEAEAVIESITNQILALEGTQVSIKVMDIENLKTSSEIIDSIIEMQDEASENFINNLEAEKDAFSELVNHQLDELDRLEESVRFEDTINELTQERISLESQIARLQGDNSIEGISKRKDLEEELAELKENLDDEFQDREFELRKQNLESIQKLVESEYDLKIERERELNEIIKERIEAQSKALKDDVDALQILQGILLGSDGFGISTFFETLKDTGLFDLAGIDVGTTQPSGNNFQAGRPTINIESVNVNGSATEKDGEAFTKGLLDFAQSQGITISDMK